VPGIVGLLTARPRTWAEPQLRRMLAVLRHESFYLTGVWIDELLGVYVGWVERRGSFSQRMPVSTEDGNVVLVFSGEDFPESCTARELRKRGHEFEPSGAAYLVHLYEEDASFPRSLNGTFHGLVADRRRGTAALFIDRYGMHRVYHYQAAEAFYFAAEAKAVLAVRPELRRLDPRGLGEFISCGCVLEDRTLFQGLHLVPGAARWTFRNGHLEDRSSYFQPSEWEQQPLLEPEAYYQQVRDTFSRNLPRYFGGPERAAVSLTGGLDTRMIMAWQDSPPRDLPCYTFGGPLRECADVIVARQVAAVCNQAHQVITVGREFFPLFPHYAERSTYLSDGCADVGLSPDLYLYERAREIAPVRITGNLGGEVLRQVVTFRSADLRVPVFSPGVLEYVAAAHRTYARTRAIHPVSFAVFRQAPWLHNRVFSIEQTQLTPRTPFLDNDLVGTVYRAPVKLRSSTDVCIRLIRDGNPALSRFPSDRGVGSQAQSIAAWASQFLLTCQFKAEYACDYGMPQWLARIDHYLSSPGLERLFLGRHKLYHFRVWYRDVFAGYLKDILLDHLALSRPYIDQKHMEIVVSHHTRGIANYTTQIHTLLTLELLHRLLIDDEPQPMLTHANGGSLE
jgi:asparagine synthase (glutamine-hydrolysing)